MSIGDKPSVVQALSAVMADVQAVGKTGRNTQQNYNFRGVDAVVNAVGPALRAHGVVVVPIAESVEYETYSTSKGTTMKSCVVRVRFVFHGPAGDTIEAVAYGESSDSGDKSTPKAHSVAFRTALLQALCIPTDEPDPDESSHERVMRPAAVESPYVSAENAEALIAKCAERGVTVSEVVKLGTYGRTSNPTQVRKDEVSAVREALDSLSPADPKGDDANRTAQIPSGDKPVASSTSNGGTS